MKWTSIRVLTLLLPLLLVGSQGVEKKKPAPATVSGSADSATTIPLVSLTAPTDAAALSGLAAPCDSEQSLALAERARTAVSGGDHQMAATLFVRAYEACPRNRTFLLDASESYIKLRKYKDAVARAEQYVKGDPASVEGLMTLGNALMIAQRWDDAKPVFERARKLEPDNVRLLLLEANNFYLLAEDGKAEQDLLRVMEMDPNNTKAPYMLGRIYYMDNRGDYALAQFLRVLRLDKKNYKAWDNLGLCYDAMGETEKAIGAYLQAIKLVEKDHPEYDWVYANLADLLLRKNDFEKAYHAASMAAKRNPYRSRNFFLGGKALMKLKRPEDAVKWFERSVALDPDFPDPLYALGQAYMKTGQKKKAIATLKKFRVVKAKAPTKKR